MALLNCPDCGKRISTFESSCPQCGRRIAPPAAGTAAPAEASEPPPSPELILEDWLVPRAKLAGGLLIGGFLLPILVTGFGETRVLWPWTLLSGLRAHQVLGTLVAPLLGAAALVAVRLLTGVRLASALAWIAGGTWLVTSILAPGLEGTLFSKKSAGAISVFTIMPLCACAVAIGNHLRKSHPRHPLPRTMAGAGGIVLVLCFLLPAEGDSPLIAAFFQSMAWRYAGPIMVVFLGLLGYGALGALSLMRIRDEASYTRLVSILARTLLWGAPATLLINFGFMTAGWGMSMALLMTAKYFALWYGHWLLLAASIAGWADHRLRTNRPATASPGTRARPASPPAGRATT